MTTMTCAVPAAAPTGRGILRRLTAAFALFAQRRALARLDQAALCDIGLTAKEAHHEASRPVWDVPSSWLR